MADDEYPGEMVMPFLPVMSKDGPYHDRSYAAGFEIGRLYVLLEFGKMPHWEGMIRTPNYEQADLICMKFGYIIEFARGDDEFTFLRIRKVQDERPPQRL